MDKPTINPEKITSRLEYFNYHYNLKDKNLFIYLLWNCHLRINFDKDKVKITSHIAPGFISRFEYSFPITAIIFLFGITRLGIENNIILSGLLIFYAAYFVICFIATENMKSIIHNWIEKDSQRSA